MTSDKSFNAPDFELLEQLLAEDIVFSHKNKGMEGHGKQHLLSNIRMMNDALPGRVIGETKRYAICGDVVFREAHWTGTAAQDVEGLAQGGQTAYFDTATLLVICDRNFTNGATLIKMCDLTGQWAVVTGGSKGIGLGIAEALLSQGANLALVARGVADLKSATEQLKQAAPSQEVLALRADFSDPSDITRFFDALGEKIPALNIFVANAGTGHLTPFLDLQLDQWDQVLNTNLRGTFVACQAAAKMMLQSPQTPRSILVISSIRALGYRPGTLPYACSKAALNQFVRGTAYELAPHGIRVNALSPGMTVTPLVLERTPNVEQIASEAVPFGRPGQPQDMAGAAVFLSSAEAGFITGANLVVDGGESIR